ncbi:hypothetical protein C0J52_03525 [Blattella germanica]|nr:hypothetical protein C0J52_03525 [Blattella germanica]
MVRIIWRWTTFIVCLISTIVTSQEIKVTINTEQHAHVVSDKFLSLMIDPKVLLSGTNLRNKRILNMAKSLAPAYIKLAGPDSNFYQFQINNSQPKDKFIITEAQWKDVNNFVKETGHELIVALNMMGRTNGSWDPNSSMELISFSNKMGYNISWQLGFELQELHTNISASQMGKDVTKLRWILDAMPQYEDSLLLGPDITRSEMDGDIKFLKQYFQEAEPVLSGITWHPNLNEQYYKIENVDDITKWLMFNKEKLSEKLDGITSKKPLWIGEKSRQYSKGVFMDALLWAHRLGNMARMGIHVIMRQPDVRDLVEASPENYDNSTNLHMYCHCHSKKSGAITFFGINHLNSEMNVTIELSSGEKQGSQVVHEYVLTPVGNPLNPLQSRKIKMNGQTLNLGMNGNVPRLKPNIRNVNFTTTITVPPYSIGFWILPDIKVKPCLTMPDTQETKQNILYSTGTNTESLSHKSDKREKLISDINEPKEMNNNGNVLSESQLNMQINKFSTSPTSNVDSGITDTIPLKNKINSNEKSGNLVHNENELSNKEDESKIEVNKRHKRYFKDSGGYIIPGLEPDIFQHSVPKNPLHKLQKLNYLNRYPKFNILNRYDRNFQRSSRNMHHERSKPMGDISLEEDEYPFPDVYRSKDEILSGEHLRHYDYIDGDESLYEDAIVIDPVYYHAPGEYFENFQVSRSNADNRFAGYGGELWEAETYALLKHKKDEEDKDSEDNEEDTVIKGENPTEEEDKKGKAAAAEMLTKYYAKTYKNDNSEEEDSVKLEREKRRNKDSDTDNIEILETNENETENVGNSHRSRNEVMNSSPVWTVNENNKNNKQTEGNFETYTFRLRRPHNGMIKKRQENIAKHKHQYGIEHQKEFHENHFDELAEEPESSKSKNENKVNEKIRVVKKNNASDDPEISKGKIKDSQETEDIEGSKERIHNNKNSSSQADEPEKSDGTADNKEKISVKEYKSLDDSYRKKFLRRLPQNPYESDEDIVKEDWKSRLYRKIPRSEIDSEDVLNTEEVLEDLRRGRALRLNNAVKRKISQNLRGTKRLQRDLSKQFLEGNANKYRTESDNTQEISDDSKLHEMKSNLFQKNTLIDKYDSIYSDEYSESYWRTQNDDSLEYVNELDSTAVKLNGHRKRESGKGNSPNVVQNTESGIAKNLNKEILKKKSVKESSLETTKKNTPLSTISKMSEIDDQIRDSENTSDDKIQENVELKFISQKHGVNDIPNHTSTEIITKESSNLETEANIGGSNSQELIQKAIVENEKHKDDISDDSVLESGFLEKDNINIDKEETLDAELFLDKPETSDSKVRTPKAISHNMQLQQTGDEIETLPLHLVEDIVGNAMDIGTIASNEHSDIYTNPHESDTTAKIIDKAMSIGLLGLDLGSGIGVPKENNLLKLNTKASLNGARKIVGSALTLGTLKQNPDWPKTSFQQNGQGIKTQLGLLSPKPIRLTDTDEKPIVKIPTINIIRENVNSLINSIGIGKKARSSNGLLEESNSYQVSDKSDDVESNTFEEAKDENDIDILPEEDDVITEEAQSERSVDDEINLEQTMDTEDDSTLSSLIEDISESQQNKFEDFRSNEISEEEEDHSEPLVRNAKDVKHITAHNFNTDVLDDLKQHAENQFSILNNRHLLKTELDKKRIEALHALEAHRAKLKEDLMRRNAELLKLRAALHIRTRRQAEFLQSSDDYFNEDDSSENNDSINSETSSKEESLESDYNMNVNDQGAEEDNFMGSVEDSKISSFYLVPIKPESEISQVDFLPENDFSYHSSLQTMQPVSESSGFFNFESIPLLMLLNIASMPVDKPDNNMQENDVTQWKANNVFSNLFVDSNQENNDEENESIGHYIEVKERSLPLLIPRVIIPHDPLLQHYYSIPTGENDIKFFHASEEDEIESDENIRELRRVQRYIVPSAISTESDTPAGSPLSVINNDFMEKVLKAKKPQAVTEDISDINQELPEDINDKGDNKMLYEDIQSGIHISDYTSKDDIEEKTFGSLSQDVTNDSEAPNESGSYNLISGRFKRSLEENDKFSNNLLPFIEQTIKDDKWANNNINEKNKHSRFGGFKDSRNSEMPLLDNSHSQDEIFDLEPFLEKTHNTYNDPVYETDFDLLAEENKKQNSLYHTENYVTVNDAYKSYEIDKNEGENQVNLETNKINKYFRKDSNKYNNEENTSLDSIEDDTVQIKEIPYKKRKLIPKKYYPPLLINLGIDDDKKNVAGQDSENHNVKLDLKMSNDLPLPFIGNGAGENMLSISLNEFSNKNKTNNHLSKDTSQISLQIPDITTFGDSSAELLNGHKNSSISYINDVHNHVNNFLRNLRHVAFLENGPVPDSKKAESNDYIEGITNGCGDDDKEEIPESSENGPTSTPPTELTPTMTARIHKVLRAISDQIVGFFHKVAPWNYFNH